MGNDAFWEKYTRRAISRRRALQLAGLTATAAGAYGLVGCSNGGSSGGTTPATVTAGSAAEPDYLNPSTDTPRSGGTFVTAASAVLGTWDPHVGVTASSAFFPRIYNLLLSQAPTKPSFIHMDLAQSYETPDEETYVFALRPGVKVGPNDLGVPERDIDAEDVKATFERLRTDVRTNQNSFAKTYIDTLSAAGGNFRIDLTEPYAWFISRVSSYYNTIPPRELLEDVTKIAAAGAGAGPYRLVSVLENDRAILERNPNYYRKDEASGAQLPYIDRLDVRVMFDRSTQRTAFLDDQIHVYWPADGGEARSLGDRPISRDPIFSYISFVMNVQVPPFNDPRARRAVSRAINRQQYIDSIYAGDAQANGLVHWPLGDYALPPEELDSLQPFDPEDARALVDALGGLRLPMVYPAETTIWEHGQHLPIFLEQMRAAGIDVEPKPLDFGSWVSTFFDRRYDCNLGLNQIYETPELPLLMHVTAGPFGDQTYIAGLGDAEVDAAVSAANTTLDLDERIEAVRAAQRVIYAKDPAVLPIVSPYQHIAYSRRARNIPTGIGTTQWALNTTWLEA